METIELLLEITERTWLQVIIDGEVQYEGLAVQGDILILPVRMRHRKRPN